MPRKPRIEYAGAIYHVMSRGHRQGEIFRDDGDCDVSLETSGQACSRTGWIIHGYVLMVNHYHLLLETPEPCVFGKPEKSSGPRKSSEAGWTIVIPEDRSGFRVVSNYIHLNPARAKQIKLRDGSLIEYPWSSFPLYASRKNI